MIRRYGNASACTPGVALTKSSSSGERKYPAGAMIPSEITTAVRNA